MTDVRDFLDENIVGQFESIGNICDIGEFALLSKYEPAENLVSIFKNIKNTCDLTLAEIEKVLHE